MREIRGGGGYLSMDPKEQHVGLADAEKVDLTIRWPNGEIQELKNLQSKKTHVIEQGYKIN